MTTKEREELIEYAIEKLTKLQIKTDFEDKERRKTRYVKKSQVYKDLIRLLKEVRRW